MAARLGTVVALGILIAVQQFAVRKRSLKPKRENPMNKAWMAMVAVVFSVSAILNPGAIAAEREVDLSVSEAFIPSGFDSDSDVHVVVSGMYPNTCYRWSRAEVARKTGVVEVRSKAIVKSGLCLMMLVPFSSEVSLGVLGAGEHTVRFMGGDGTYLEKRIVIEE